jgi:hypothetical protein
MLVHDVNVLLSHIAAGVPKPFTYPHIKFDVFPLWACTAALIASYRIVVFINTDAVAASLVHSGLASL